MNGQQWVRQDLYAVLGVAHDCAQEDIKRAYRTLARRHHPDANAGASSSEQCFKKVTAAYAVLSDPDERARYDAVRGTRLRTAAGPRQHAAPGRRPTAHPMPRNAYPYAHPAQYIWPMGTMWSRLPLMYWAATWSTTGHSYRRHSHHS